MELLKLVINILKLNDYRMVNADITLMAERPKVAPHIPQMTQNLLLAGLPPGSVNIKATRGEGMGFVGREEGMAALAIALVERTGE
jgi:2-C-methyl-D-erythritol 2,4-cyclodiphosphate synthase